MRANSEKTPDFVKKVGGSKSFTGNPGLTATLAL